MWTRWLMFGAVPAAGINILAHVPAALRSVLESGVASGGICAALLSWFLPPNAPQGATLAP